MHTRVVGTIPIPEGSSSPAQCLVSALALKQGIRALVKEKQKASKFLDILLGGICEAEEIPLPLISTLEASKSN
jgi:hypothetical protein